MNRFAAHVVVTAALILTLAAAPAAMAGPTAAAPGSRSASTAAPEAAALVPIPCPDARQVGATSYARRHGLIAFSVKQFYSPTCHSVYAYAYPWLQFRELKQRYGVGLAVFDAAHDAINGARSFVAAAGDRGFWSAPYVPPAGACTQGLVHIFFTDTETDTLTREHCW
ncbi:hypothetical protein KGA66_02765 [Actinocrinis puniceicyclus]|uniref:Uncharacterized protein n=1 Tax=Actinocrinis puniceicyclus TaxID=977794 RepID=A0A8J7WJA9_9ACTN|nr:hypothetical protein [Actinocrinis puniceicyclus]MBS2961955.1 hypothetical protein [Actinocrinis puniceicyclus]